MGKPVKAIGIECPFIREGNDVASIVVKSILQSGNSLEKGDVIGITESVVARSQGNYVTVDEVTREIVQKFGEHSTLMLYNPIYSRNRFSIILRAFARACDRIILIMPYIDEVGNVVRNHPFTGLDYEELYKSICEEEHCDCFISEKLCDGYISGSTFIPWWVKSNMDTKIDGYVDCTLHHNGVSTLSTKSWYYMEPIYTLMDFCNQKCDWGLLGSNKVNEEKLKLFPSKAGSQAVCDMVKAEIKERLDVDVAVMIFGDGCFFDPVGHIWEFADPITSPGYTDKELMESTPHELKLKELIDNHTDDEVRKVLSENVNKKESSMGTTPRLCRDLLASLMDLVTGSGERSTPCVLVKGYFA